MFLTGLNGNKIELNSLYNSDCFPFMQNLPAESINIIYTDPPYNMNSRYYIDKQTGHYKFYGKGSDFMSKWDVWDGEMWDKYFTEAFRIVKPGGFIIMHNIDRQADLWSYYARRNNFMPVQKLYWLFITNFPKAVDAALQIDNKLNVKREVIEVREGKKSTGSGVYNWNTGKAGSIAKDYEITEATSEMAKKYNGYKYGQAACKQILEEILVFWKGGLDSEATVDKIINYENQLSTGLHPLQVNLHPPVMNIGKTMVLPSRRLSSIKDRHTPQLLIADTAAMALSTTVGHDTGSKIWETLWKIRFWDDDTAPYIYEPKISKNEKEEGLDELDYTTVGDGRDKAIDNPFQRGKTERKNSHPTPKPINLCKAVLELFKTPDDIIVMDTFTGQGSIPKACKEMGITYLGTELSEEFYKIALMKLDSSKETLFG